MTVLVKEKSDGTEAIYNNVIDVYRIEAEEGPAWRIVLVAGTASENYEDGEYATFHLSDWDLYILKR